ncbi:MAG: hypothetical protein U1F83_13015 [Verrucomicrobiota bacterium]
MVAGISAIVLPEQNCRLFAALLLVAEENSFRDVKPVERERFLRVLAYVCKEEDAIPGPLDGGLADDQREVLVENCRTG